MLMLSHANAKQCQCYAMLMLSKGKLEKFGRIPKGLRNFSNFGCKMSENKTKAKMLLHERSRLSASKI